MILGRLRFVGYVTRRVSIEAMVALDSGPSQNLQYHLRFEYSQSSRSLHSLYELKGLFRCI